MQLAIRESSGAMLYRDNVDFFPCNASGIVVFIIKSFFAAISREFGKVNTRELWSLPGLPRGQLI